MHLENDNNQEALISERFGRFVLAINIKRALIQFDDTPHPHTRPSELSTALSGMSITEMKQF
jgi:hypothetical protein